MPALILRAKSEVRGDKHRPEVAGRGIYYLQHLGGRDLLLQRLLPIAGPQQREF